MKSSIELRVPERQLLEKWQEPKWEEMIQSQLGEVEGSARAERAIVRGRKIKGAVHLLRLVLAYAVCDWSLRLVGAWATIQGIADLSDVALLYRFCRCGAWLGHLIGEVLQQRSEILRQLGRVRLRLVDATVISRPGSEGTDWRIHLSLDVGRLSMDGVEITDGRGGESLVRFAPRADEIYVADRGYAFARGLGSILAASAYLVVRINWNSLPLQTQLGLPVDQIRWLKGLTSTTESQVRLVTPQGTFPLRCIAYPLPAEKAKRARQKVCKQMKKKGKKVSYSTWLAAGFVVLVTNLPAQTWDTSRILYLYRLRWQIELYFKRLKSLLQLDHLRAQDPQLVQAYLLAKLLAALLLDQLAQSAELLAPSLFQSLQRPASIWRLQSLFLLGLRQTITGSLSLTRILAYLPYLHRYLCDSPRARPQQLAWARRTLARLLAI